jgi:CheY-like chemotaxis protein
MVCLISYFTLKLVFSCRNSCVFMNSKKICLLVDDDLDDHEIFSLALGETGKYIELKRAFDGVDALEKLSDVNEVLPDFIFMDLNMPRMNGKQCLEAIKKHDRLKDIPVVIYSTSSEIKDLIDAQQLGAIAFIVKSPSINDLTMALSDFFKEY